MWSARTGNQNTMRDTQQKPRAHKRNKKENYKQNTKKKSESKKKTMVTVTEKERERRTRVILCVCGMNSKTFICRSRQPFRVCRRCRDHSVMMPSSLLEHNVRKDNNNIIVIIIVIITSLPRVPSCARTTPSYNESGTHD